MYVRRVTLRCRVGLLVLLTFAALAQPGPICGHPASVDAVCAVTEEISILNLLRGLYLTKEQTTALAALASEAQAIRTRTLARLEQRPTLKALQQLRDDLYTSLPEEPPKSRPAAIDENRQYHHIVGEMLDEIAGLEDRVASQLTRSQIDVFWGFAPCVVPEIDFEQPVRVGQVAGSAKTLPIVELIRSTPEHVWRTRGREYLQELMAIFEREVGKMTPDVRGDLQHRINMIALKIRRASDVDFMTNKGEYARELMIIEREKTLRSGHRRTGKLARFFLSPAAAVVLPRWYESHWGSQIGTASASGTPAVLEFPRPASSPLATPAPAPSPTVGSQSALPPNTVRENFGANACQHPCLYSRRTGDVEADRFAAAAIGSFRLIAEVPFLDHVTDAFGIVDPMATSGERARDVDIAVSFADAANILTNRRARTMFTQQQGEP